MGWEYVVAAASAVLCYGMATDLELHAPPAPRCMTCAAPLDGPYCSACGQRRRTERLHLRTLLRDAFEAVTDLDASFPRTLRALVTRPGDVARDYIGGRTKPYVPPLRFLILATAAITLVSLAVGLMDGEQYAFLSYSTGGPIDAYMREVNEFYIRYMNVFMVASVPLMALLTRVWFRRESLTYAEHLVFNAYAFSATTLISALVTVPLLYGFGGERSGRVAVLIGWMAISAGYYSWACLDFYAGGVLRRLIGALTILVIGSLVFSLASTLVLVGYAWLLVLL